MKLKFHLIVGGCEHFTQTAEGTRDSLLSAPSAIKDITQMMISHCKDLKGDPVLKVRSIRYDFDIVPGELPGSRIVCTISRKGGLE